MNTLKNIGSLIVRTRTQFLASSDADGTVVEVISRLVGAVGLLGSRVAQPQLTLVAYDCFVHSRRA